MDSSEKKSQKQGTRVRNLSRGSTKAKGRQGSTSTSRRKKSDEGDVGGSTAESVARAGETLLPESPSVGTTSDEQDKLKHMSKNARKKARQRANRREKRAMDELIKAYPGGILEKLVLKAAGQADAGDQSLLPGAAGADGKIVSRPKGPELHGPSAATLDREISEGHVYQVDIENGVILLTDGRRVPFRPVNNSGGAPTTDTKPGNGNVPSLNLDNSESEESGVTSSEDEAAGKGRKRRKRRDQSPDWLHRRVSPAKIKTPLAFDSNVRLEDADLEVFTQPTDSVVMSSLAQPEG